jgi:hypothetical protein
VICRRGTFGLGSDLTIAILDLSETGIRLLVRDSLREREPIELSLTGPGQGRSLKLLASVIWCVPAADGTYCVGARFEKALRYMELQILVTTGG